MHCFKLRSCPRSEGIREAKYWDISTSIPIPRAAVRIADLDFSVLKVITLATLSSP